MRINVNPNRMESLKLKKRKKLAQRGHQLLQDKLEKLISEFHKMVREFKDKSDEFRRSWKKFVDNYYLLLIQTNREERERIFNRITPLSIKTESKRLLNLILWKFSPLDNYTEETYYPSDYPPQYDILFSQRRKVLNILLEMISIYISMRSVGEEILKTRRRVNALEYILIPRIELTIKYIDDKLIELEREFVSRLLRIKDVVKETTF